MTVSELRAEQNIASGSSSCSYTDGAQYVGCQTAARGWPMPQSGGSSCSYTDGAQYVGCQTEARGWPMPKDMSGGRKRSKKSKSMRKRKSMRKGKRCYKSCRRYSKCSKKCICKCHKGGMSRRKKGGFGILAAALPLGLLAAQKSTQRNSPHPKKHKNKSSRRR